MPPAEGPRMAYEPEEMSICRAVAGLPRGCHLRAGLAKVMWTLQPRIRCALGSRVGFLRALEDPGRATAVGEAPRIL